MLDLQNLDIWQVIIALIGLAVAAVSIGVTLWDRSKNRKRFGYFLEGTSPLISPTAKQMADLAVVFNGTLVTDPYLTTISFFNLGRLPIAATDYEKPISIDSRAKAVLAVVVTRQTPVDLEVNTTTNGAEVVIAPLLLNGGDNFVLSLITEGASSLVARARVLGVSQLEALEGLPVGVVGSRISDVLRLAATGFFGVFFTRLIINDSLMLLVFLGGLIFGAFIYYLASYINNPANIAKK